MPQPASTRVTLRDVEPADLPAIFQYQLDPEANRMAVVHPRDPAAFDAHWAAVLANPSVTAKAILLNGVLAGHISCFKMDARDTVGYWIARDHWRRGVATEALAQFLRIVPARPLHARAARTNVASIRVLEKCGFSIVGYETSPATDRFLACEEAILQCT